MATSIKKGDCVGIVFREGNKWIVHDGVLFKGPKNLVSGMQKPNTQVTILHFNKPNTPPQCLTRTALFVLKTTKTKHNTKIEACPAKKTPSIKPGKCVTVTFPKNSGKGKDIKNGVLLSCVTSPKKPGSVWINHWKFAESFKPTSNKPPTRDDIVEESKEYTKATVKAVKASEWTCS